MAHKLTRGVWLFALGAGLSTYAARLVLPKTGDADTDALIWMAFCAVLAVVVVVSYKVWHRWSKRV